MTLLFEAKATPTAITGQNLNEVILNPVEIPHRSFHSKNSSM